MRTFSSSRPAIPLLGAWLYAGCYDVQGYSFECTGVFTNTVPTDAYRGAGRPEATYAIERAVDALARKLGKDPVEIRRLNFIREFPATIKAGLDDRLRRLRRVARRRARASPATSRCGRSSAHGGPPAIRSGSASGSRRTSRCAGSRRRRILGAIRYSAGGWEAATIRCLPTGTVQVLTGSTPHGQGHETSWSQIVADRLGYEIDEVEVLHGDTAVVPLGMDTYGSRSLAVGGVALYYAAERIVEKAKKIAAHLLEVDEAQVDHVRGTFHGPESSLTLKEIAFAAWTAHNLPEGVEPGLEATYVYDPPNFSWPAGAHVAIVEVDTETGAVELLRYIAVDDVGTVINPTIVDGQIHGGLAQGVAQALYEEAIYDEDGNLLTGNMVSYLVPSAAEFPRWELHRTETPSPTNPMGVKGVGETGAIASPPAVMNAVVDALADGRHHRHRHAGDARASVACAGGGAAMIPAPFDYEVAESVDNAIELLGSREETKVLAGGHSLLPLLRLRLTRPSLLVDVGGLTELSYVRDAGDSIAIGALTRHHDVATAPLVAGAQPARVVRRGADRRPAGSSSRHDRRLARARRSRVGPARGRARARRRDRHRGRRRRSDGAGRGVLPRRLRDGGGPAGARDGGAGAEAHRRPRLELSEVPAPGAGLGDGRRRGGRAPLERRRRGCRDRAREHGRDAAARRGRRGGVGGRRRRPRSGGGRGDGAAERHERKRRLPAPSRARARAAGYRGGEAR